MSRPVIRRLDPYLATRITHELTGFSGCRLFPCTQCAAAFTVDRLIERSDAFPSIPIYARLSCPVTEDDIKFFEGNPARRYRIRELQRTGRQRHMAIVDRAGRETIFPVGESFIPHDSDVVLSSLVSSMTAAAMARWK